MRSKPRPLLRAGGQQYFAGAGHQQLIQRLLPCRRPGEFRGAELAGRNVEQRNGAHRATLQASLKKRCEKVVLLLTQAGVQRRARRKHPRDLAPDDLLGELGVFHLVADGDAVALAQQARQVALHGVIGNPAHGLVALPVAGRQGQLQLAADGHRVVVEKLVKVPHAEKQQGIGILALGRCPLAHEGGQVGGSLVQGRRLEGCGFEFGLFVFPDHVAYKNTVVERGYDAQPSLGSFLARLAADLLHFGKSPTWLPMHSG